VDRSTVVADDQAPLASVVGDDQGFLDTTFGRTPWRGRSAALPSLFGIDDVDAIVSSGVRVPAIRMVRGGQRVPPADFCSPTRIGATTLTDAADARKVLDAHRRGATLVLQSLHRTWPSLIRWSCALEEQIGWPVQANAYLTPAHERGLDRHADGHDVLVLQLHGSKQWWIDGLGDLHLRAGDVLYVPAGTDHVAETHDEPSLHLTIGIHRPTDERIARSALDLAQQRVTGGPDADGEHLTRLAVEFGRVGTDEAIDRLRRPPRTSPLGELASALQRGQVGLEAVVRPAAAWDLETLGDPAGEDDARVALRWSRRRLTLPRRALDALEQLARCDDAGVAIGDLRGLGDDERLVVARRLLDEGALSLA
jgi:hypothetical protein